MYEKGYDQPDCNSKGWPSISKYDAIRRYLESQPATTPSLMLGFREIEGILGFPLPQSARKYKAWWANDPTHSQSIWLNAGWETSDVDMASERVTFVRTRSAKRQPLRAEMAPHGGTGRFQAAPEASKRRIGLIACTKAKLNRPAPARELYSASDLFSKAAAYCDAYLDGWFVLSAKYGLVEPDRIIAPYDMTLKTMPRPERRLWGTQVAQQLRQLGEVALEAHAGAAYVRPLLEAGIVLDDPLRGLSIGRRKRWYLERLKRPTQAVPPESVLPPRVARTRTRTRGRETTLRRMEERVGRLVADFVGYVRTLDKANPFMGPSWYFHFKTLAIVRRFPAPSDALRCDEFFDYLYATLTSWGLHRMGPGKTKLADLSKIKDSFLTQEPAIREVESLSIHTVPSSEVSFLASKLWTILDALRIGIGETKIVGGSKALHHLLPNLVPPIDRSYTLRFFYNRMTLNQGDEVAFKEMYPYFHRIAVACHEQISGFLGHGMNTSETKVIDNAIVGFVLEHLKERRPTRRTSPSMTKPARGVS